MSTSFISDATPKTSKSHDILGDEWFPTVNQKQFSELYRNTGSVTPARQVYFLKMALAEVCGELSPLKSKASSFYDLRHIVIGDETDTELNFKTAVYALAKSMLTEMYRDFDNTAQGHDRADTIDSSTDKYMRESREAIRRLLGRTRITATLI